MIEVNFLPYSAISKTTYTFKIYLVTFNYLELMQNWKISSTGIRNEVLNPENIIPEKL